MKSKRMLGLLLCAAMTAALAACGDQDAEGGGSSKPSEVNSDSRTEGIKESSEASGTQQEGGLVWNEEQQMYEMEDEILSGKESLKVWVDNDEFAAALKSGFEEKYPGTELTVEVVSSTESVGKMILEGEAGTGADVFVIPHDRIGDAMNSSVIGMMGEYDNIIRDTFLDSAIETIEFDGNLYGVPYLTESVALIYNKTLLQKLQSEGLIDSAEPAADMNDIKELAEKYNDPANNVWTIRWEAGNSYTNHMFVTASGYRLFGEDGTDPDAADFGSQSIVDGLTYFRSFREFWNVNSGDATWDTTVVEFAKGETPYLICGPWAMQDCYKGAAENNFEVGVVPLPKFDGKQPYTFSGVQVACVSSYSKYPAAARALAMYIGSDEMLGFAYKELAKLPALKDASKIAGLSEDVNSQAFMQQANYSMAMPSIPEISYFWTVAEGMYRGVWDGTISPEDAAVKTQNDYEALRLSAE